MRCFFACVVLVGSALVVGCGPGKPASVVDSSDTDKIAEYERMMAEEEKQAAEAMKDSGQ